jgi:hypothetical protein
MSKDARRQAKQNPVGVRHPAGFCALCSVQYREPRHEEGIRLPSKRIAVCSDPDSGTPKKSPAFVGGAKETAMRRGSVERSSAPTFPIRVAGIGFMIRSNGPRRILARAEFRQRRSQRKCRAAHGAARQ